MFKHRAGTMPAFFISWLKQICNPSQLSSIPYSTFGCLNKTAFEQAAHPAFFAKKISTAYETIFDAGRTGHNGLQLRPYHLQIRSV
jgi:hypothetical protein